MVHEEHPARRGRGSAAPWFLALAVLLLVVAGVATLLRSRAASRYTPPLAGNPEQPIDALRGTLELPRGARLVAELAPLHPEPARQAFEAQSLRRRFGLEQGEPWRLHLRWDEAAGPDGQRGQVGTDLERGALQVVGVAGVELHDGGGLAARVLEPELGERGPVDPVAALLGPPTGGLGPGQAVDVVLWGRRPEGRVELRGVGLGPAGAPESGALLLEPTSLARADLERAFTHQTRGEEVVRPGKTKAAGTSERAARSRATTDG